jgi:hypothetical protein
MSNRNRIPDIVESGGTPGHPGSGHVNAPNPFADGVDPGSAGKNLPLTHRDAPGLGGHSGAVSIPGVTDK